MTIVCEVKLGYQSYLIEFDEDDLAAVGEDIIAYWAWMEDGLLNIGGTLRGDESPAPEYATDVDGPWLIHEREVARHEQDEADDE